MALTVDQLRTAVRAGPSSADTEILTRLLGVGQALVQVTASNAPETVRDEAVIRVAAYLYDQPNAGSRSNFATAMRSSGAMALLMPWRVHRAGIAGLAETMAEAAASGNPVVNVAISGSTLTVTFQDGTTRDETLPAGGDGAVDQTARDAAAAAQATADAATTLAQIADWAETGNSETIPDAKIPAGIARDSEIPDAYTLPAAAAGVRGGVQAVTNAIIDANTSTGIFGWALSHVRRVVNAIVPEWARSDDSSLIPESKVPNLVRFSGTDDTSHANFQNRKNGDLIVATDSDETKLTLFRNSSGAWVNEGEWRLGTDSGSAPTISLLVTLDNIEQGTNAQYDALRTWINDNAGGELRLEAEYPRTFGTITDGKGYTEARWRLPAGLTLPARSNSDTYLREFAASYSDQSGTAEALSLILRPGGTVKLSMATDLPSGFVVKIYGVN